MSRLYKTSLVDKKQYSGDDRFFGRRKGRPLNKMRQKSLALLETIAVPENMTARNKNTQDSKLPPSDYFQKTYKDFYLEIGFGNGEFLARSAKTHPEIAHIGAEPFINGVAALCKSLNDQNTDNIRIWPDDVRFLLDGLKDNSISRVYILNPDPWPKKRHHKRRIVNPEMLDRFARVMKPSAQIIMTSDIDDLAQWMAIQIVNHSQFRWDINNFNDVYKKPDGWQATRYEEKGRRKGHKQFYLKAMKL